MSTTLKTLAEVGKKFQNHTEIRHIELNRLIRPYELWPEGKDKAPADVKRRALRAKEIFFKENALLVVKFCNKWHYIVEKSAHMDMDDLVSEACIGFNRAIERFDSERSTRFSTIATWWLRQAVFRYMEKNRSIIHIPTEANRLSRDLYRGEIKWDELTAGQKERIRCCVTSLSVQSLDFETATDGGGTIQGVVADPKSECQIDDPDTPWQWFEADNPALAYLLVQYHEGGKNTKALGTEMSVSSNRICVLKNRAKVKLAEYMAAA